RDVLPDRDALDWRRLGARRRPRRRDRRAAHRRCDASDGLDAATDFSGRSDSGVHLRGGGYRERLVAGEGEPISVGNATRDHCDPLIQRKNEMANVAFLGLGVMGFPMAGWLAKKGPTVTVYNRTRAKSDKWREQNGGAVAGTPAEAAKGAEIVFSCVGDDPDLRASALGEGGGIAEMKRGAIYVDHTPASAGIAREIDTAGRARGVACLDAPVSGGQAGAENGKLTVMVGGDSAECATGENVTRSYTHSA